MIPLSNFWRTLEMTLINCEVNLILTWSANNAANQGATFAITEASLYVQVVTLSAQDNAKLLTQLKLGFISIKTRIIKTKSKFESFS